MDDAFALLLRWDVPSMVVGAVIGAVIGFLSERFLDRARKREARTDKARVLSRAVDRLRIQVTAARELYSLANQEGAEPVRGYFLQKAVVVTETDLKELSDATLGQAHHSKECGDLLRDAISDLERLHRKHRTMRDSILLGDEWKAERSSYYDALTVCTRSTEAALVALNAYLPSAERNKPNLVKGGGKNGA